MGAPGQPDRMSWHARLDLNYSRQGDSTQLQYQHEGPLRILRSLYPEGPRICHNVIVHPPGGLVEGDVLAVTVNVASDAHALLSTPGATRFYSPLFPLLGGAYMDMGNAFMQNATLDVTPHEGDLVLFPAFLPHKALPYVGTKDRIVVSFNAQIRAPQGDQIYRYAAA